MAGPVEPPGKSESFELSEGDLVQMQRRKWTDKRISELEEGVVKIIRWIWKLLQGGKELRTNNLNSIQKWNERNLSWELSAVFFKMPTLDMFMEFILSPLMQSCIEKLVSSLNENLEFGFKLIMDGLSLDDRRVHETKFTYEICLPVITEENIHAMEDSAEEDEFIYNWEDA
jgi:hypothetical protein